MAAQRGAQTDVEALQKRGGRRGCCLDAFLVVSVVFLFVAVTAVAAVGVWVAGDLRDRLRPLPSVAGISGSAPYPEMKMQKFAYLQATSSHLRNSTMMWKQVHYGAAGSVGNNFLFDPHQHTLKPKRDGQYFMYIELNLTCTYKCKEGVVRVRVGDKLTCEVRLPAAADSTPVRRNCWTVSHMKGQKLLAEMTVPEDGLQYWRLELEGSGLGMFLVD